MTRKLTTLAIVVSAMLVAFIPPAQAEVLVFVNQSTVDDETRLRFEEALPDILRAFPDPGRETTVVIQVAPVRRSYTRTTCVIDRCHAIINMSARELDLVVLAHEIGHAVGREHSVDSRSIMCSDTSVASCRRTPVWSRMRNDLTAVVNAISHGN